MKAKSQSAIKDLSDCDLMAKKPSVEAHFIVEMKYQLS